MMCYITFQVDAQGTRHTYTCDGEVDISACLAIIVLCAFDDDQVSWEVDPPSQSASGYQYLHKNMHRSVNM